MPFNFIRLPELDFDLKAETTEQGRKYVTPEGKKYPSVTTVLSSYNKKAIYEWRQRVGNEEANRIAGRASRRGTQLHTLCEKYILGELTGMKMQTLMPLDKMMFGQLRPLLDNHVGDVYCLEQPLYSDKLRLAGRVDLIAEWDGELSVIEYIALLSLSTKLLYFLFKYAFELLLFESSLYKISSLFFIPYLKKRKSFFHFLTTIDST